MNPVDNPIQKLLYAYSTEKKDKVTFLNIGAFDGKTNDHLYSVIHNKGWNGILVEPLPEPYKLLQENYCGTPNIILENCAISKRSGSHKFYKPIPHYDSPHWVSQLGSFSLYNLKKHGVKKWEIVEVATLSINDLMRKHNFTSIDVLQVDTEGHDAAIVTQALTKLKNNFELIIFEHKHLMPREKARVLNLLISKWYAVGMHGDDIIAINKQHCRECLDVMPSFGTIPRHVLFPTLKVQISLRRRIKIIMQGLK